MRRLVDYVVWRFGSRGRGPLAYRMLAGVVAHTDLASRRSYESR
jgi:hypothetical protein